MLLLCPSCPCRYRYPVDPSFVVYSAFSDDVESVFTTKGLEKAPTAPLEVFVPPDEVGVQPLTSEEEEMLEKTMQRLAERVSLITHIIIITHHMHIRIHVVRRRE